MFQVQAVKKALAGAVASGALALGAVESASAAVPTDVTTALSSMGTDALTIAGVVLVAIIGLAAFKFMRKAI